jgi:predicted acyltransferase
MPAHDVWRSLLLVFLGVFLRSVGRDRTNFTFEDTLSQIGLGYTFLFLLGTRSVRAQWIAFVAILVGYWGLFAAYPLPASDFPYSKVGAPESWNHLMTGFPAHWNKNSNPAWSFDVWFLNLFPRESPFLFNKGGWSTLSFIPTLATMILGLWAGQWLRTSRSSAQKLQGLVLAGIALTLSGLVLQWLGLCPIVKRIWTSSYTLYSGGLVVLILSAIYAVTDLKGWTRWMFPLVVIGSNSIAVYVMSWTIESFVGSALRRHLGEAPFAFLGPVFEHVLLGASVLAIFWLVLFWMYRRKIFVRL